MPVNQQYSQEPTDIMVIRNVNLRHPRHLHGFFQHARPYKGEPPTVAGFLLYPDTPAKMETTSHEAFCFRPVTQPDRGKGKHVAQNTQQESHLSHPPSSRQTRGNSSRDGEQGEDNKEGDHDQTQNTTGMQSQYQKDFPPPSSCHRRRTPAFPQPDNIGINRAFRIEFRTVQKETYPGWPILNPRELRATLSGEPNMTSE
ncbi:hypothetical protein PAMA_006064 [Pampus argenteus]